jgi:hypothetical protein
VKRDLEHLHLLVVFHFVLAALLFLTFSVFLIHVGMGIAIVSGAMTPPPPPAPTPAGAPAAPAPPPGPPLVMGWVFIGLGSMAILFGWAMALCLLIAGICLRRRKAHTFCFVIACIACMWAPLGTLLGIFTIIVLVRPTVKDLFAGKLVLPRDPEDEEEEADRRDREQERLSAPRPDDDRFAPAS